jgi:hypothetical protein
LQQLQRLQTIAPAATATPITTAALATTAMIANYIACNNYNNFATLFCKLPFFINLLVFHTLSHHVKLFTM